MIIIIQIGTVPVLLHLDQIHLLLLAITTTANLVTPEVILVVNTTHQTCCGMDLGATMTIITAVPTLICLGSFGNFPTPFKIGVGKGYHMIP